MCFVFCDKCYTRFCAFDLDTVQGRLVWEEFGSAYVFLAKALMDTGMDLNEAAQLAEKGISLTPDLKTTVLAHFVLADIYNRLGRANESRWHVDKARELQKSLIN